MIAASTGHPLRIAFVIRSLERGGAERHVATLAPALLARGHSVLVATLRSGGEFEEQLPGVGVPVQSLAPRGLWLLLGPLKAIGVLRRFRADVVYGVMPHGNLTAWLAAPLARRPRVVFGIRGTRPSRLGRWWNRPFYRLEASLARGCHAVIANSSVAARWAIDRGVPPDRVAVVPNGIDAGRFRPDPEGASRLRAAWGVASSERVVGRVGSFRPVKGNDVFLKAVAGVARTHTDIRAVMVGDGPERSELEQLARRLGIAHRVIWTGDMDDVPAAMSAFDVHISSSRAESFPTVVAEAMACGTPCVVTDVGDSSLIVGETGVVVAPDDPGSLRSGIDTMLDRLRHDGADELGARARARVIERFGLAAATAATEDLLDGG